MLYCFFGGCECAFVCSWRGQRSVLNVFFNHSYFLKTGSLAGLKLTDSVRLASQPSSPMVPPASRTQYRDYKPMSQRPASYRDTGHLNSVPHTHIASALPTQFSSCVLEGDGLPGSVACDPSMQP